MFSFLNTDIFFTWKFTKSTKRCFVQFFNGLFQDNWGDSFQFFSTLPIIWAILFSVALPIFFVAFSMRLGSSLLIVFKPVFTVSRPAYAKLCLLKKLPRRFYLLTFILGMSANKIFIRYTAKTVKSQQL